MYHSDSVSVMKRSRAGKSKLAPVKGQGSKPKGSRRGVPAGDTVAAISPYQVHEKILCYEPDPAKCKVLYEAKILKITSSQDDAGKMEFQYLVHFQGWNSSWDRYVADDLIMKDNEETRKLQEELNLLAAAQQQKKGKQKVPPKVPHEGNAAPVNKRPHKATAGRRRVVPDRNNVQFLQLEQTDGAEDSEPEEDNFNIHVNFLKPFSELLHFDYISVALEKKVPQLPAPVSAMEILERFVKFTSFEKLDKWYKKFVWEQEALQASTGKVGVQPVSAERKTPDELLKILNEVEITKQLATDTALVFDVYVERRLLYNGEKARYEECIQNMTEFVRSATVEVPEGLKSLALDQNEKSETMEKIDQQVVAKSVKKKPKKQPVAGSSTSSGSGSDAKESSTDTDEGSGENVHYKETVGKHTKELEDWSLVCWKCKCPRPSLVYGLPHLLRQLIQLPEVLYKMDLKKSRMEQVSIFVNRLIDFIVANFTKEDLVYGS